MAVIIQACILAFIGLVIAIASFLSYDANVPPGLVYGLLIFNLIMAFTILPVIVHVMENTR